MHKQQANFSLFISAKLILPYSGELLEEYHDGITQKFYVKLDIYINLFLEKYSKVILRLLAQPYE